MLMWVFFYLVDQVMVKGGEWFELGDDKDMKLPRPLVDTMFPPLPGDLQLMGLDKWYLMCLETLMHAHTHTHTRAHTHAHAHTHTHARTHTRTHIHTRNTNICTFAMQCEDITTSSRHWRIFCGSISEE